MRVYGPERNNNSARQQELHVLSLHSYSCSRTCSFEAGYFGRVYIVKNQCSIQQVLWLQKSVARDT